MNNFMETKVNTSLDSLLEKIESLQQQMDKYHAPGLSPGNPVTSCADFLADNPSAQSGYYWIGTPRDSIRQYCDMTLLCGGVTGGWLKVAGLDMKDSSQQCPSDLKEHTDFGIRTCRTNNLTGVGCSSAAFPVTSHYSKVCGKIIGYQVGTPDTFGNIGRGVYPSIDAIYMDGVSLTHGNPRQHIWTFAAGLDEASTLPHSNCPCTNIATASQSTPPPAFVGNNYFCDTGIAGHYQVKFYGANPLWDGAGCGPQNTCCSFNNPPWFFRQLPQPTTDNNY